MRDPGDPTITVRCGELYCDRCGDCIACYGNDDCVDGWFHTWDEDGDTDG